MAHDIRSSTQNHPQISAIELTGDTLTSRTGPLLFVRYIDKIDGTSRHLTRFDDLKQDRGYAATIERRPEDLISSHAVKRFIGNFSFGRIWLLRKLLQEIFITAAVFYSLWETCTRLAINKPEEQLST